jgi:hypothetical protein
MNLEDTFREILDKEEDGEVLQGYVWGLNHLWESIKEKYARCLNRGYCSWELDYRMKSEEI